MSVRGLIFSGSRTPTAVTNSPPSSTNNLYVSGLNSTSLFTTSAYSPNPLNTYCNAKFQLSATLLGDGKCTTVMSSNVFNHSVVPSVLALLTTQTHISPISCALNVLTAFFVNSRLSRTGQMM